MSESRNEIWNKLARLGLAAQTAVLALAVALLAAPLLALAYAISETRGVIAALVAAVICLVGGEIALVLSNLLARRLEPLQAVLVGMMARMAVPLVLGLIVHFAAPSLTAAGMFFYFLAFYAVVLAVETMLSLAHLPQTRNSPKAS